MATLTSITGAERLPDGDYSVPHRAPPPIPSVAYDNSSAPSPPPQLLNEPGRPDVSESGSVRSKTSKYSERRRGSLGSLLRRASSHNSQPHRQNGSNSDIIPPVPSVPATRNIAQAAVISQNGRDSTSTFSNRKVSGEGRTMLRKSSKMKAAQEQERVEQERLARATAPPPRLPSHNPLPGIDSFGGDHANNNAYTTANFSRPGNTFYNMPSSGYNSSSSPAYATRGTPPVSSPGRTNGEYVDAVDRHESMTHRGRYSYASSTVPVNVSSPRRIRRRKDPTPFK